MDNRSAQASKYARVVGSPGEWARFSGLMRAMWPFGLMAVACGYLIRELVPFPYMGKTVVGFLFLLLAGALAWLALLKGRSLGLFLKGAQGEEWVARELAFLPAGYTIFHGIHRGQRGLFAVRGDYDHIVVGPNGIFAIETKNWSGEISVRDGKIVCDGYEPPRQPPEQARRAAAELRRLLGRAAESAPAVQPVVCFAGGHLVGGRQGAGGVIVCDSRSLNEVILARPEEPLSESAQNAAVASLDRLSGSRQS